MDTTTTNTPSRAELSRRVGYSLLASGARLARLFRMPAAELQEWVELAYFHELRAAGYKLREVSAQMGISPRKAAQLSARLKQNFLDPEREVGLPRRIEFMLWAGPLSAARLYQVLPAEDPDAIDAALATLVESGRVVEQPGARVTYRVSGAEARLARDATAARVDGLNHLVAGVFQAAYGRFFGDAAASFARTLGLRVRREDLPELARLYEDEVWPALRALDAAASADPDAVEIDVALCWGPSALPPFDVGAASAEGVLESPTEGGES
ncbi:MAG: hypothetical protein H6700_09835 [Myxococcales bacterium]|nr:hypothetical protein [Myxococcales bacterium]MCB9532054.1 hypothetical protein [Myxococcales bacterium]